MNKNAKLVGVLGGLGPKATAYFTDMVVDLTNATCDQEHVDMIICNRSTTPDRTAFIIGESSLNPAHTLTQDALKLQHFGADFIVMTCNTAHYFYDSIVSELEIPFINLIEETVLNAKANNHKKVGILATTGNINTNLYQNMCEKYDLEYVLLTPSFQEDIMSIIYEDIKQGKPADMNKFSNVINYLKDNNCDGAILGCTELSVLRKMNNLYESFYIDSLEVLARKTISLAGKKAF